MLANWAHICAECLLFSFFYPKNLAKGQQNHQKHDDLSRQPNKVIFLNQKTMVTSKVTLVMEETTNRLKWVLTSLFGYKPNLPKRTTSSLMRAHSRGSFNQLVLESAENLGGGRHDRPILFRLLQVFIVVLRLVTPASYLYLMCLASWMFLYPLSEFNYGYFGNELVRHPSSL